MTAEKESRNPRMSPRVAKKDRGEVPKPQVNPGTLGFFPLNRQALSSLCQGHCDVIIGPRDAVETLYFKQHPWLRVRQEEGVTEFGLNTCFFNGISDAFYRGKLPQVLVLVPDSVSPFLNEFLEHLDKMVSLGFFLDKLDPVEILIPHIILASNGVFFNGFMQKLASSLEKIPALEPDVCQRILGKFARGVFSHYTAGEVPRSGVFEPDAPPSLRVASASNALMKICGNIFREHELAVVFEEADVENPAERLEVQNALHRLATAILPSLTEADHLTDMEARDLLNQAAKILFDMGKRRKALTPEELATGRFALPRLLPVGLALPGDPSILHALTIYADVLNQPERAACFENLKPPLLAALASAGKPSAQSALFKEP